VSDGRGHETTGDLGRRLKLMILTRPTPACGRPLVDVVRDCLAAGATAIQLRDKDADARSLATTCREVADVTRTGGALFIVNDRVDVALAIGADGVHLGPDDLPVAAVRAIAPPGFVVGYSTDDPTLACRAREEGADYLGVGAVFGTRSKPGLENEAIGAARVHDVLEASGLPGVGIGGIDSTNAAELFAIGAGVAVLSSVMGAPDPPAVVSAILAAAS